MSGGGRRARARTLEPLPQRALVKEKEKALLEGDLLYQKRRGRALDLQRKKEEPPRPAPPRACCRRGALTGGAGLRECRWGRSCG